LPCVLSSYLTKEVRGTLQVAQNDESDCTLNLG
jgi:hypothetical protein